MIIVILIILGLAFGSFVNALVWRIYQQSLPEQKRVSSNAELSIIKGRSMCPGCRHSLAWYDLLPLLSWISLAGRCRYCKKCISPQYPIVEALTAMLFVTSYLLWPDNLDTSVAVSVFAIWLAATVGFVALVIYDIRWMLLPNKIVFPLVGFGLMAVILRTYESPNIFGTIMSALGGFAVAGGIFYVVYQISNGKWIGGGDVKLGFALGLLLGSPLLAFLMLFFASLIGLVVAIPGIFLKKSKLNSKLPFGPFLIVATIIVMLVGQRILDWYMGIVLYL